MRIRKAPVQNSPTRIAVLLPLSAHWAGQLMRGIAAFARRKKSWNLQWIGPRSEYVESVRSWDPQGVLAFFGGNEAPPAIERLTTPIVAVNSRAAVPGIPSVSVDQYAIGQIAAEHFARRGVINYACLTHQRFSEREPSCKGFIDFVRLQRDCRSLVYCAKGLSDENVALVSFDSQFVDWLNNAPKPLGLFAVSDRLAMAAIQVCRQLELRIPQDVAILGADDDATICQICDPMLSSVRSPLPQVGFEAARMLDGMISQRQLVVPPPMQLRPLGVTVRHSCDVCAVDDVEIAQVLRLIYGTTGKPLSMKELLKRITLSRRALEQRFRTATGRSPMSEMRRVALERAARLLVDSNDSIANIAQECGFSSPTHFSVAFSRQHSLSPARLSQTAFVAKGQPNGRNSTRPIRRNTKISPRSNGLLKAVASCCAPRLRITAMHERPICAA